MKLTFRISALALLIAAFAFPASAQFSVAWHKISGGGGTSAGGGLSVSGTIGQHDASTTMSGGNYSLTGGFWGIYAVPVPGAPALFVARSGNNVVLWWPASANGFLLETKGAVGAANGWSAVSPMPVVVNGFNYVTNSLAPGNKFYRLHHQ